MKHNNILKENSKVVVDGVEYEKEQKELKEWREKFEYKLGEEIAKEKLSLEEKERQLDKILEDDKKFFKIVKYEHNGHIDERIDFFISIEEIIDEIKMKDNYLYSKNTDYDKLLYILNDRLEWREKRVKYKEEEIEKEKEILNGRSEQIRNSIDELNELREGRNVKRFLYYLFGMVVGIGITKLFIFFDLL